MAGVVARIWLSMLACASETMRLMLLRTPGTL